MAASSADTSKLGLKTLKEAEENMTECPMCFETLKDARMLPCGHSFCLKCLLHFALQSSAKHQLPGDDFDCPLCRNTFKLPLEQFLGLPINHFANKLIEVNNMTATGDETEAEFELCCNCLVSSVKNNATDYCVDCEENLCKDCIRKHDIYNSFRSHKIKALSRKTNFDKMLEVQVNHCSNHPDQQVHLYCYDCRTTVCVMCYVDEHQEHKCSDIKKALVELSQHIDQSSEQLKKYVTDVEIMLKQVADTQSDFKTNVQSTEAAINKKYADMKALLDSHHQEILSKLKKAESEQVKKLETVKEEGEHSLMMMKSFEKSWNELKVRGSACDVVEAITLQIRVKTLIAVHEDLQSERAERIKPNYCQIQFTPCNVTSIEAKNFIGELGHNVTMGYKLPSILVLDPAHEILFRGPFDRVVTADLVLKNPSSQRLCFKVMTTAPKQYCVRPNNGFIEPTQTVKVQILLAPFGYDPRTSHRHRFLVKTMVCATGEDNVEQLWNDTPTDQIVATKLACVFDGANANDEYQIS